MEIKDIEIVEISIVDKPANRRKFLLLKRLEGESMPEEIQTEQKQEGLKQVLDEVKAVKALCERIQAAIADLQARIAGYQYPTRKEEEEKKSEVEELQKQITELRKQVEEKTLTPEDIKAILEGK